MKIRHLFGLFLVIQAVSSIAHSAPLFQAGDIEEGKKWSIDAKSGVASYFANGTAGKVEFKCDLRGAAAGEEGVKALLRTGKNFDNEYNLPVTPLNEGMNGLFIWTLTDEKADVGNIKVFYVAGSNATIQCYGKKIQD